MSSTGSYERPPGAQLSLQNTEAATLLTPICATCAAVFPRAAEAPAACPICEDRRQWVPSTGQAWTSMSALLESHDNRIAEEDLGLIGVGVEPSFAIAQRMLLVKTPVGNVLWDMIPLCTDSGINAVREHGEVNAIAISHPHYYSGMLEWSSALGDIPILLHEDDREWVTRPDSRIDYWQGEELKLDGGLTLVRLGGHFPGGTVLLWPDGASARGTLLSGDIVQVMPHGRSITVMWSYPNMLPLAASEVARIAERLSALEFDRIWGAWWARCIPSGGKQVIQESLDLYLDLLQEGLR
jgi:glyoxylase-like metal-dependent hydrolase (beta-lactamase superfamily II)